MGAWGAGPFQNDDALDFLESLESSRNPRSLVEGILRKGAKSRSYLELPDSCGVWAAAELIAVLRGTGTRAARASLATVAMKLTPSQLDTFTNLSIAAIARLDQDSELFDLSREAGKSIELRRSLADLRRRLSKTPKSVTKKRPKKAVTKTQRRQSRNPRAGVK